ncbi:MAG: response regulator [Legionellaceae bacterium]|nr:response regulator [Legionellaceae bacterium]
MGDISHFTRAELQGIIKICNKMGDIVFLLDAHLHIIEHGDAAYDFLHLPQSNPIIQQALPELLNSRHIAQIIDLQGNCLNSDTITTTDKMWGWSSYPITTDGSSKQYTLLIGKLIKQDPRVNKTIQNFAFNFTGHEYDASISDAEYIKEMEHYLTSIINKIPCIIYWKNKALQYVGCNDMARTFVDIPSRDAIIGMTDYELFDDQALADSYRKDDAQVLKTGIPILNQKSRLITRDGRTLHTLVSKAPIKRISGDIAGVVGITVDVTEQVELSEKLQIAKEKVEVASRAKSEFIANMSHDIRTPLSGIIGIASILEDEAPDESIKEYAHMLNISGEQLLSLLNSVLELVSTGSLGKKKLNLNPFSIKELLNNILELERPSLTLKDIAFKIDIGAKVPDIVISDKEKIYRILLNLLSNAIKFTHDGSISITVNLVEAKENDIKLCFKVIDTGIGIAKDDIHKVFDQFYRTTSSYEGNFDGYGVGLHIAREYLDRLNGNIEIESEVGVGTAISLTIPMKQAALSQPIESELETVSPRKDSNIEIKTNPQDEDAFVLLVEDNFIARKTATNILTKAGCRVMQADTSAKAFELCQNHRFDFILSDIGLPDYSGLLLAQQIRIYEEENNLEQTPIIGLSAHTQSETIADAKASGMLDLAEKPLKTRLIEKLIYKFGHSKTKSSPSPASAQKTPTPEQDGTSQQPLFDAEQALAQLGDRRILKELLEHVVKESIDTDMEHIDAHYHSKDWAAFKKAIHKFKSNCLYCATPQLLTLTQTLEHMAANPETEKISSVYDDFKRSCRATKRHIEQWLEENNR